MTNSTTDDVPASEPEKSQLERDIGLALEVKNSAIKNLRKAESDLLERNNDLYDDARYYQDENVKLAAENQKLQAMNQGLQRRYDEIAATLRQLKQDKLATDREREHLRTEKVLINNEKAQLLMKCDQLERDYEGLCSDYDCMNHELHTCKLGFEKEKRITADLRAQLQKSQEEIRKYQDYIERQKGFNPQAVMTRAANGEGKLKLEFPVITNIAGKKVICDPTKQPFGAQNTTPIKTPQTPKTMPFNHGSIRTPHTPDMHFNQESIRTPHTPKNMPFNQDFYRLTHKVSPANSPTVQNSERQLNSTFRASGNRPRSFSEAYGDQISRLDNGLYNPSHADDPLMEPMERILANLEAWNKKFQKNTNFLKQG